MDIRNTLVAQNYAASKTATAADPSGTGQFVAGAAQDFVQTLQKSEATAMEAMTAGADPHALVQALAQTELAVFYDILREGLRIAFFISIPILTVALISGLVVGLFQALTSVQEMTLTFVPKLAAIIAVFWATMGFMTETLVTFFQATLLPTVAGF